MLKLISISQGLDPAILVSKKEKIILSLLITPER